MTSGGRALGVPATRIHEIVKERRGITADTAERLARYFGGRFLYRPGRAPMVSAMVVGADRSFLRLAWNRNDMNKHA
jgi:hypothetical protein